MRLTFSIYFDMSPFSVNFLFIIVRYEMNDLREIEKQENVCVCACGILVTCTLYTQ